MSSLLAANLHNRNLLIRELRRELMGPYPGGRAIPLAGRISFPDFAGFRKAHVAWGSRQEILTGDPPRKRYGIGVLYPETPTDFADSGADEPGPGSGPAEENAEAAPAAATLSTEASTKLEAAIEKVAADTSEKGPEDFDITLTNLARPRSMGLSFLAEIPGNARLLVRAKGGRYVALEAAIENSAKQQPRSCWYRRPVHFTAEFSAASLLEAQGTIRPEKVSGVGLEGLDLRVEAVSRPLDPAANPDSAGKRLLTICLVNRSRFAKQAEGQTIDTLCLFQARFSVQIQAGTRSDFILPYPDAGLRQPDDEELSNALLYRKALTFATGHGCAPGWTTVTTPEKNRATRVSAVPFPVFETPSITPEIHRRDRSSLTVPMAPLAGLVPGNDGMAALREVLDLYRDWIRTQVKDLHSVPTHLRATAKTHLRYCGRCYRRMLKGLAFLQADPTAAKAFQLANHAILLQQIRSFRESRKPQITPALQLLFEPPITHPDPLKPAPRRGTWRPFQVAFLLMCLESTAQGKAPERDTVELIWFPTGGGKTEAYLGLSAFAIFYRRLTHTTDAGTSVLMRYTLRLLTAQQFQRAAGLICAMEYLRRQDPVRLGTTEFSIGIWLGGDTTPNDRKEALRHYRALTLGREKEEYQFVLLRCPWCGCQMGPLESPLHAGGPALNQRRRPGARGPALGGLHLLGLKQQSDTVQLHCPDIACDFNHALPVYVVDEDIYATPPDLVIGTVDKFAMLAWKSGPRALFGLSPDGTRKTSPPGLIIQDELHLITGPLGSMVGLYETIIEDLCTDHRVQPPVRPKIVSSTATTRRYRQQVLGLYGRDKVVLFPPPGLDAGDSFFAAYARENDGRLKRGRIYVGVCASAYPSGLTTNVKVFSSLLHTPMSMDDAGVDPWYTLLIFYNSLRELGANLTLFQADIPEKLYNLYLERCIEPKGTSTADTRRFLNDILELTGRISSGEVPLALQELERVAATKNHPKATDVCLASNIIEVGVDVDRLSLMCVNGQPKTTAQYIQVTGRVGRNWQERPGLVVTIYSPNKPRDRSHFERFPTYHGRLYAQVEPASVTPFTTPALERALHAILVAYVRQTGNLSGVEKPLPFPKELAEKAAALARQRQTLVDATESAAFEHLLAKRLLEWKAWQRQEWHNQPDRDPSLLRYAGSYYPPSWAKVSWPTPSSMRNVDAECQPEITLLYAQAAGAMPPAGGVPVAAPAAPSTPADSNS